MLRRLTRLQAYTHNPHYHPHLSLDRQRLSFPPIVVRSFRATMSAEATPPAAGTHLDEVTGEMVSKQCV